MPAGSIGLASNGTIDDISHYRQVLGSFMTGVTIITTIDADGRPRGLTANSFTSVSLDPPLVLFCVDYRAASYETFQQASGFAIHVLGSEQQELARTFASKSESKFEGLVTDTGVSGAPILRDVHGWLDCELSDVVIAGDHAIVIGEVKRYSTAPARPLGFYQGRFFGFNTDQEISATVPQSAKITVGWMMQSQDGNVIAVPAADGGLALPQSTLSASRIHAEALTAEATELFGLPTSTEFLYSVYEGRDEQLTLVYRGQVFADSEALRDAGFLALPPGDVDPLQFRAPGEEAVVDRYLEELANARFGLYAGSLAEGSIAQIEDITSDRRTSRAKESV